VNAFPAWKSIVAVNGERDENDSNNILACNISMNAIAIHR